MSEFDWPNILGRLSWPHLSYSYETKFLNQISTHLSNRCRQLLNTLMAASISALLRRVSGQTVRWSLLGFWKRLSSTPLSWKKVIFFGIHMSVKDGHRMKRGEESQKIQADGWLKRKIWNGIVDWSCGWGPMIEGDGEEFARLCWRGYMTDVIQQLESSE